MSSHTRWSILVSIIVVGTGALGCAGAKHKPVTTPEPAPEEPVAEAPPLPDDGQPGYGQSGPKPVGPPPTSAGGQATPIAPAAAAGTAPVLMALGQSEAASASPDGGAFAGQFEEGQVLEQPVNVQAGKCYSVVAAGVGIAQLDLQLVLQNPPLPPTVAAQSNTTGPNAVLGGKASGCFKNPLPMGAPGKVVMKATRGAGVAAAQIYVK